MQEIIERFKKHTAAQKLNPRTNRVGLSPDGKLTNVFIPTDRPFRVSVEGNIGAGKSTLIEYFSKQEGIETYPEPIALWRNVHGSNYLELLYSDINKWLKVFQGHVQFTRMLIQTTKPNSGTKVQMFERSLQNNRFCFLEDAFNSRYLDPPDYHTLAGWYDWIRDNEDIDLDLIVYLRSTPERVFERVKSRGRPEEADLSLEYLKNLHKSHENWLMSDDRTLNTIPVLVLDADKALQDIYNEYQFYQDRIIGRMESEMLKVVDEEKKGNVKKCLDL